MVSRNSGTVRRATTASSITNSNRFTGASRPTATIDGYIVFDPPGTKNSSTPLGNAKTRSGKNPSSRSSSRRRVAGGDGEAAPVDRRCDSRFKYSSTVSEWAW